MTDTGWVVTGLVALVITLFGLVIRNIETRLGRLEQHTDNHDKWAGEKAVELATVGELAKSVLHRLDRQDGILDVIREDIKRLVDRVAGRL